MVSPSDYAINTHQSYVYAKPGQNSLNFKDIGCFDDSYGLTIDNVKLVRDGTAEDIVVNGGFEEPNQNGGYTIINNIPGWSGVGLEIGKGTIYNYRWTSQVIELAGHRSYDLTQRWRFDTNY